MSEAVRVTDPPIVVCDANVFYSIVATDLILSLGVAELFPALDPADSRGVDADTAGKQT